MSGAAKTYEEVRMVRAALARYESKIDKEYPWLRGDCCQGCAYGRPYLGLCEKIDRVRSWLEILENKIKARAHEEAKHCV